jgi:3D (Asp-Asp-Asp) domain-containing protein
MMTRFRSRAATVLGVIVVAGLLAAVAVDAKPVGRPRWLSHVGVTQYFPVPESWFSGARVWTPGVTGLHRVDWLYSARGMSMEGDGVALDGRRYHIDLLGAGGWVNAAGRGTRPTRHAGRWTAGRPFWRAGGYWIGDSGRVTFPLAAGGWFAGAGHRQVEAPAGIAFASGPSRPLRYWSSVAVDPKLIALGSRIYVPAYRRVNGGWFRAEDTGGAIIGRHLDLYVPPPTIPSGGTFLTNQRVFVVPPTPAAP